MGKFGFVLCAIDKVVRGRIDHAVSADGRQRGIDAGRIANLNFRVGQRDERIGWWPSGREGGSQLAGCTDEGNSHAISLSPATSLAADSKLCARCKSSTAVAAEDPVNRRHRRGAVLGSKTRAKPPIADQSAAKPIVLGTFGSVAGLKSIDSLTATRVSESV
jgi:hypothetical protein